MATCDEDVAKAVASWFGINYIYTRKPQKENWSVSYRPLRCGVGAVRLMEMLYPAMGKRRQGQIVSALGYVPNTTFELDMKYWLIGLLEGEGTFLACPPSENSPTIRVMMTDKDIVERLATMWNVAIFDKVKKSKPHHRQRYSVGIRGKRAVDLMKEILPFMSQRRQKQILRAIESYKFCSGIGEAHPNAKFTIKDIGYIKSELAKGERGTAARLAREFDVDPKTITWIKQGRNWGHIET